MDIVIDGGEIVQCFIKDGGGGYASPPTVRIDGDGKYAKIVPTVTNGVIINPVNIVDTGKGYTSQNTTVTVVPSGQGGSKLSNPEVSEWKVDFVSKYRKNINQNDDGILIPENQNENFGLKYVHAYVIRKLRLVLQDNLEDDYTKIQFSSLSNFRMNFMMDLRFMVHMVLVQELVVLLEE